MTAGADKPLDLVGNLIEDELRVAGETEEAAIVWRVQPLRNLEASRQVSS